MLTTVQNWFVEDPFANIFSRILWMDFAATLFKNVYFSVYSQLCLYMQYTPLYSFARGALFLSLGCGECEVLVSKCRTHTRRKVPIGDNVFKIIILPFVILFSFLPLLYKFSWFSTNLKVRTTRVRRSSEKKCLINSFQMNDQLPRAN